MAVATLALIAQLVLLLISLLFVLLTEGLDAAGKHYWDKATKEPATQKPGKTQEESTTKQLNPRALMIFGGGVIGLLVDCGFWLQHYWEKKKIKVTNSLLAKIAIQLENGIEDPETQNPVAGPLAEREACQRPLEYFVDETLTGTLLVISENGPGVQPGRG